MTKRFSKLAALIMVVVALMAFVGMQASATDTEIETLEELSIGYKNSQGVVFMVLYEEVQALTVYDYSTDNGVDVVIADQYMIGEEIYTVTAIDYATFYNCTDLESVVIPSSIISIGYAAFEDCGELTINYAGTEEQWDAIIMADDVFLNTTATIICSDTTTEEDEDTEDTTGIEELTAKFGYYYNSQNVQFSITSETELTLGVYESGGAVVIGADIVIAEQYTIDGVVYTVTSIGDYGFSGASLSSIVIPSSVTSIGYQAFAGFYYTLTINYAGTAEQWGEISIDDTAFYGTPVEYVFEYTTTDTTTPEEDEDTEDTTVIEELTASAAYYRNSQGVLFDILDEEAQTLTVYYYSTVNGVDVVIADQYMIGEEIYTVKDIDGGAFYNCTDLESIVIPTSVTSIGDYAFYNCGELTINYAGTEAQWAAITIAETAFDDTTVTIVCSDTTTDTTTPEVEDEDTEEELGFFAKIFAYIQLIIEYITSIFNSGSSIIG